MIEVAHSRPPQTTNKTLPQKHRKQPINKKAVFLQRKKLNYLKKKTALSSSIHPPQYKCVHACMHTSAYELVALSHVKVRGQVTLVSFLLL